MSNIPDIFTQTPVESLIITKGLEAQLWMSNVILGTPFFKGVVICCILISIYYMY
jgi:hypothetical protein